MASFFGYRNFSLDNSFAGRIVVADAPARTLEAKDTRFRDTYTDSLGNKVARLYEGNFNYNSKKSIADSIITRYTVATNNNISFVIERTPGIKFGEVFYSTAAEYNQLLENIFSEGDSIQGSESSNTSDVLFGYGGDDFVHGWGGNDKL